MQHWLSLCNYIIAFLTQKFVLNDSVCMTEFVRPSKLNRIARKFNRCRNQSQEIVIG